MALECAKLVIKRGKVTNSEGILLPDGRKIKMLARGKSQYKYLGVLETDEFKHEEMKANLTKEYFRRVRNVLQSKLNGANVVTAINTRAVSLL